MSQHWFAVGYGHLGELRSVRLVADQGSLDQRLAIVVAVLADGHNDAACQARPVVQEFLRERERKGGEQC